MGDANQVPTLPDVQDEAGDTPMWVPAMGVAVLFVLAVWAVWPSSPDTAPPAAAPAGEVVADNEPSD